MKGKTGGRAVVRKGNIVIEVPVAALQAIVDGAFCLNGISHRMKVTDAKLFAREITRELNRGDEQGTTPVHRCFDAAIQEAFEQGAEGVEEHPNQEI
jgi:ribosomal protein S3